MGVPVITIRGLTTSRLGLGCSPIGGRISLRQGRRSVDEAFDLGVTHFDVARSYGYGLAESALRPLLRRHRDKVTIATKAGITPGLHPVSAQVLGSLARGVRRFQAQRTTLRRAAGVALRPTPLDVSALDASLDTSLSRLGVNAVDVLFLHEPVVDGLSEEVVDWLGTQRSKGKARLVGLSTVVPASPACKELPDWMNFQVAYEHYETYRAADLPVIGVHSIFRAKGPGQVNPLATAASHEVISLVAMFTRAHLEQNCGTMSGARTIGDFPEDRPA